MRSARLTWDPADRARVVTDGSPGPLRPGQWLRRRAISRVRTPPARRTTAATPASSDGPPVFASPELVGADELVEPAVGSEIVVPAVGPAVDELLGDELGVPDEDETGSHSPRWGRG